MLFMMIAAVAGANPATINKPRQDFVACIRAYEQKSINDRVKVDAYDSGIKTVCVSEAERLTQALIAYDMSMGGKRATAVSNAAADVDDYRVSSSERFHDVMRDAPQ